MISHNSTGGNSRPGGLPTLRWRPWEEALGGFRFFRDGCGSHAKGSSKGSPGEDFTAPNRGFHKPRC